MPLETVDGVSILTSPSSTSLSSSLDGLNHRPLVLVLLAFAGGVLIASGIWLGVVPVALSIWISLHPRRKSDQSNAVILAGFAVLGAVRFLLSSSLAPNDISRLAGHGYATIHGTISSEVDVRQFGYSCQVSVDSVATSGGMTLPASGLVQARLGRADDRPPLDFGDSIEARGPIIQPESARTEGGFDYAEFLAHRGVHSTFLSRRSADWRVLPADSAPGNWLARLASRSRRSMIEAFETVLKRPESSLLSGITIGARSGLPKAFDDDFIATGTVHILATAGLHVGAFAVLVAWICRMLRFPRRTGLVIQIAVLALFTVIAGARPSVIRADVMASVILAGALLRREPDAASALSLAGLLVLIWEPGYLFDMGFQLSFATVGTLIAFLPLLEPYVSLLRRNRADGLFYFAAGRVLYLFAGAVAVSFAAQIGSAPITAQYFNELSLISVPANALIVPLIEIVIGAGLAVWLLAVFWIPAANAFAALVLSPILAGMIGVVRTCAGIPGAVVHVASPGWLLITFYYLLIGWAIWRLRTRALHKNGWQ